jgi:hypothetical protein
VAIGNRCDAISVKDSDSGAARRGVTAPAESLKGQIATDGPPSCHQALVDGFGVL